MGTLGCLPLGSDFGVETEGLGFRGRKLGFCFGGSGLGSRYYGDDWMNVGERKKARLDFDLKNLPMTSKSGIQLH